MTLEDSSVPPTVVGSTYSSHPDDQSSQPQSSVDNSYGFDTGGIVVRTFSSFRVRSCPSVSEILIFSFLALVLPTLVIRSTDTRLGIERCRCSGCCTRTTDTGKGREKEALVFCGRYIFNCGDRVGYNVGCGDNDAEERVKRIGYPAGHGNVFEFCIDGTYGVAFGFWHCGEYSSWRISVDAKTIIRRWRTIRRTLFRRILSAIPSRCLDRGIIVGNRRSWPNDTTVCTVNLLLCHKWRRLGSMWQRLQKVRLISRVVDGRKRMQLVCHRMRRGWWCDQNILS